MLKNYVLKRFVHMYLQIMLKSCSVQSLQYSLICFQEQFVINNFFLKKNKKKQLDS